jgi:Mg-chelatase subunit ChlD
MNISQAKGFVAGFAIEMDVRIFMVAFAFTFAEVVVDDTSSVLESVNDIMLGK